MTNGSNARTLSEARIQVVVGSALWHIYLGLEHAYLVSQDSEGPSRRQWCGALRPYLGVLQGRVGGKEPFRNVSSSLGSHLAENTRERQPAGFASPKGVWSSCSGRPRSQCICSARQDLRDFIVSRYYEHIQICQSVCKHIVLVLKMVRS